MLRDAERSELSQDWSTLSITDTIAILLTRLILLGLSSHFSFCGIHLTKNGYFIAWVGTVLDDKLYVLSDGSSTVNPWFAKLL